jgi:hypothetical protein
MGTRADFYVEKHEGLEWLGSIAWDGHEIDHIPLAATEAQFRQHVEEFFAGRDDVTRPERGWPWPWNDSRLTDYAYVFVDGVGVVYRWGDRYDKDMPDDGAAEFYVSRRLEDDPPADWEFDEEFGYMKLAAVDVRYLYPNMRQRQNVRMDGGSGLITVSAR